MEIKITYKIMFRCFGFVRHKGDIAEFAIESSRFNA